MKLHPLLIISVIFDLVKNVFQKINNLDVCFFFFLLTDPQIITDVVRETEYCDQHDKYDDSHNRVPRLEIHPTRPSRV